MNCLRNIGRVILPMSFLALFLTISIKVQAAVYYVSQTTGNDSTGYGTPGAPWATINHAISVASASDTLNVAAGIYTENVFLNKALSLLGGYDPGSWTRNIPVFRTVLDGRGSGKVVASIVTNGPIIDGFVIQNGDYGV